MRHFAVNVTANYFSLVKLEIIEMNDRRDARKSGHKSEKGDDEWLTMKSRKLAYKLYLHCKLAASLVHLVKLIVKVIMKNTMNLLLLMCSDEDFSDAELHPIVCDLLMICEVQQDTLHGMCVPLFLMLHLFKYFTS